MPSLIVVSAPSGAGKSTVVSRVLEETEGLRFSVSHTTRPPRDNETDGREYHFVDRAAFERLRAEGALLEWAEVHGNLYGTGLTEWEKAKREGVDLLLDLDVQGADQVRARVLHAVTVFIMPPSYEALEARLRGRNQDDEATIRVRLAAAGREIHAFEKYQYVIVNDDVESCVRALKSVVGAARQRTDRLAERAREIERTFLSAKERETV